MIKVETHLNTAEQSFKDSNFTQIIKYSSQMIANYYSKIMIKT